MHSLVRLIELTSSATRLLGGARRLLARAGRRLRRRWALSFAGLLQMRARRPVRIQHRVQAPLQLLHEKVALSTLPESNGIGMSQRGMTLDGYVSWT